jgi:D-sedoheptulose 7-phosphate isomerase
MKFASAIRKANRVYIAGNGGSAANSIHFANDLISVGIKAQALTADVATLTAIANDFDYVQAFAKQITVFGEPGDLLILLSGSGKSPNILAAALAAKEKGVKTWAITGAYRETEVEKVVDHHTKWGTDMQDAEEKQLYMAHRAMKWLRNS